MSVIPFNSPAAGSPGAPSRGTEHVSGRVGQVSPGEVIAADGAARGLDVAGEREIDPANIAALRLGGVVGMGQDRLGRHRAALQRVAEPLPR